jgi:hypothetical protein
MKQAELEEIIKEEIRAIIISHKNGGMSDEEYYEKMMMYNEICGALNA